MSSARGNECEKFEAHFPIHNFFALFSSRMNLNLQASNYLHNCEEEDTIGYKTHIHEANKRVTLLKSYNNQVDIYGSIL